MAPRRRKRRKRRVRRTRHVSNKPVSDKKMVRLKYTEQISLDPGAAAVAHFLFRANSMFDPNSTGGGHQPVGFDQWAIFYNFYSCISSKIKVTFFSTDPSEALTNGIVGIYVNDDNISTTTIQGMVEFQNTKYAHIGPGDGGSGIVTVRNSYNAAKTFGRPKSVYTASSDGTGGMGDSGPEGFNPKDTAVYDIFVGPARLVDDLNRVDMLVEIWYTCLLFDRRTLPGS